METDPLAWRLAGNAAGPAAVLGTTDTTPLDMIVGNVPAVTIGDQSTVDGVQFRPAGPVQAGVGPAGMYDLVLINDGTSLLLEASETISKQIGTGAGAGIAAFEEAPFGQVIPMASHAARREPQSGAGTGTMSSTKLSLYGTDTTTPERFASSSVRCAETSGEASASNTAIDLLPTVPASAGQRSTVYPGLTADSVTRTTLRDTTIVSPMDVDTETSHGVTVAGATISLTSETDDGTDFFTGSISGTANGVQASVSLAAAGVSGSREIATGVDEISVIVGDLTSNTIAPAVQPIGLVVSVDAFGAARVRTVPMVANPATGNYQYVV